MMGVVRMKCKMLNLFLKKIGGWPFQPIFLTGLTYPGRLIHS